MQKPQAQPKTCTSNTPETHSQNNIFEAAPMPGPVDLRFSDASNKKVNAWQKQCTNLNKRISNAPPAPSKYLKSTITTKRHPYHDLSKLKTKPFRLHRFVFSTTPVLWKGGWMMVCFLQRNEWWKKLCQNLKRTSNALQTYLNSIHLEKPRSLKRTWNVLRKHPANTSSAPQRLEVECLFTERLGKAARHFITGSSKTQFHAKVNACAENLCYMQTNASMARYISSANNVLQSQRQQTDPHLAQMMERANVQKTLFCKFETATVFTARGKIWQTWITGSFQCKQLIPKSACHTESESGQHRLGKRVYLEAIEGKVAVHCEPPKARTLIVPLMFFV